MSTLRRFLINVIIVTGLIAIGVGIGAVIFGAFA